MQVMVIASAGMFQKLTVSLKWSMEHVLIYDSTAMPTQNAILTCPMQILNTERSQLAFQLCRLLAV